MDYMIMTEEDFERLEERLLEQETYWATGGSLALDNVIQNDDAAPRISAGRGSE